MLDRTDVNRRFVSASFDRDRDTVAGGQKEGGVNDVIGCGKLDTANLGHDVSLL